METREGLRIDINGKKQTVNVGKHEIDFETIFHLTYGIIEMSKDLPPGCPCIEFIKSLKDTTIVLGENGKYTIHLPYEG